jgi:hypothetical protein
MNHAPYRKSRLTTRAKAYMLRMRQNRWKMKPGMFTLLLVITSWWHLLNVAYAQEASFINHRLYIEPSSVGIPIGKASLAVSPLDYRKNAYVGEYLLKVWPLYFMSEKGTLKFDAPDESVHKLAQGLPVDFQGKAISKENELGHAVSGKITPQTKDRGLVVVTISTGIGKITAKTSYRLSD